MILIYTRLRQKQDQSLSHMIERWVLSWDWKKLEVGKGRSAGGRAFHRQGAQIWVTLSP